ncbi:hypothetical protein BU15DRAFT_52049, partial [Melanogaster broomeanus]
KKRARRTQGKRNQTAETSKKTRRGKLEMLPELNLDVLFQILSLLHPMDLLNLARTTKAFRQLLMRKSSAFVWKTARSQVEGLPDCPSDLSEPQYANLVFYPRCHVSTIQLCHGTIADVALALRACCINHSLAVAPQFALKIPDIFADKFVEHEYSYSDKEQSDACFKEYSSLPQDKREEYLAAKRLQVCAIDKHADECEAWHKDMTDARKFEREGARVERAVGIFTRLKGLGYEAEINHCGTNRIEATHRSVFNSTKTLTDKEWDRVRPQLEQAMQEYRSHRLEEAVYNPRRKLLVELYDAYIRQPAPSGAAVDLLPDIVDLAHLPTFDTIIKLPEGTDVNAETFKPAFDQIPTLVQEWRASVDAQLAALVVIPSDPTTSGVATEDAGDQKLKPAERLRLASALFRVDGGLQSLMMSTDFLNLPTFNNCYSDSVASREISGRPWSLISRYGNSPLVDFFTGAAPVVRACGMDPQTATVEDMDQRNARLTCNHCIAKFPQIHTWRSAVS